MIHLVPLRVEERCCSALAVVEVDHFAKRIDVELDCWCSY